MLDNEKIKKMLSLSDEELKKKIYEATVAAGGDKYMTVRALADMQKLRTMIGSLNQNQINELLSRISPDVATELSKQINNKE